MTDSTDFNYPTADEPIRDSTSASEGRVRSVAGDDPNEGIPAEIGAYAIRQFIGAGGMGKVYLAEHKRMQRVVAIKMLPIERMADDSAVERFYDEVRTASRLMHPAIVTAFDAGESDGLHYFAMEYVDGKTLAEIVANQGPLALGEAATVILQASSGLLHAHRAGIIHRDVKPANLMRTADGSVKVLDLGLARISNAGLVEAGRASGNEAKKSDGRLTGTLPFMSPEQLDDADTVDARSDIYSLGATLYFLLTAQPPYTGNFLDLINGHRYGEIPDLMMSRDDVDLRFANIFNRMMAKSPAERYASLDEVIDELAEYAGNTDTTTWNSEFGQPAKSLSQQSTFPSASGTGSTSQGIAKVFAVDFGMFYATAAEASPSGGARVLSAGQCDGMSLRTVVSSDEHQLIFGNAAMERRAQHAKSVVHCIPMYIGKKIVERKVAGQQCPPEVLMAMLLQRVQDNSWTEKSQPKAIALTVPGSYDQLHRQSFLQAAKMAGLHSVRLLDRSIAAVQSLMLEPEYATLDVHDGSVSMDPARGELVLFVGLTGQALEVSVIRREGTRLQQLSIAGHWHVGSLPWLQRLVDMAADAFLTKYKLDPRKNPRWAARLQLACERAMNSMLLLPAVKISIQLQGRVRSVRVERRHWLQACETLAVTARDSIETACREASVKLSEINSCVLLGPLLRISVIRDSILRGRDQNLQIHQLDRVDAARGAAACLASELPGRGDIAKPPRVITGQTIGIVVSDSKGRRRILPIIPKGTSLPARTNRRLTAGTDRDSMTLSLVESAGVEGHDWQSLGSYEFDIGESRVRSRMIGFEINLNGILSVRAQTPGTSGSTTLHSLPTPTLCDEDLDQWSEWIKQLKYRSLP